MLLSHCRRFEEVVGVKAVEAYTEADLDSYKAVGEAQGLSEKTIVKLLMDVRKVIRDATGVEIRTPQERQEVTWAPGMGIVQFARQYVRENRLHGKTPIYSAQRFADIVGNLPPEQVTEQHLKNYREACLKRNLSPNTIESSIGNIQTMVKALTGKLVECGRRLKIPRPSPHPVDFEDISAVWMVADLWLKQFIALTYWTGLRLGDAITLQKDVSQMDLSKVKTLRIVASKTQQVHAWPLPDWLKVHLRPTRLPYRRCTDNAKLKVRVGIADCCERVGIAVWTPKQLRQRSVTEWSRSNATAGALIHGSGIGVLAHYIDPMQIIEAAADGVRVPACLRPKSAEQRPNIADLLTRLDDSKRAAFETMLAALIGTT